MENPATAAGEWHPLLALQSADLARFSRGEHWRAWQLLGAHTGECEGIPGTRFSVWAPNAEWVSVIGDFNGWDGHHHRMSEHSPHGVWECFIPGVQAGALYKFQLRSRYTGEVVTKIDPFGRHFEARPRTASIVAPPPEHQWHDRAWQRQRARWQDAPLSIYEIHAGSWRRHPDGSFLNYRELADGLVETLHQSGFTHVELMPVTEHPLDASWGYQATGFFAPTSRFGTPDDFRYLVDRLHGAGIGVILDWVPAHFPKDDHALARFDGTALFEHADPARETPEWGTLAFNLGRHEVQSFLISSALYWLEHFHLDGLRIDAVASMLYLDYGRSGGEWTPNAYGGNENLEAISFLQELNRVTHGECPGTFTIAEESTAWPGVTRPVHLGGLGFSMKWNMGWMHDTLAYMREDPVHRRYHHDRLTFGLLYAFHENFILPLSHDEVVHGKGSLLDRMPGDEWQRFANLRLLYAYMFAYPGKKLLFMGSELAQPWEWAHEGQLDGTLAEHGYHAGVQRLVLDLNRLYAVNPALHRQDFSESGFEWIDCHDSDQSVISFLRRDTTGTVVVVCNFTPVPRYGYRIGVPQPGVYRECLNSDSALYGGSDVGNLGGGEARAVPWMGRPATLSLTLPPLGAVYLELEETGHGIDENTADRR
ncbi:1,4-alpha-glucan branching protein GlgB [Halomonas sp. 22501_18_FS]|uniref:1,4-alpha-glucan branching enzyme GlgB n=2 Tax=Oceanospirillales TaxID=135619 RepID=A0A9X4YEY2_9GAMM|nr:MULTISPECIES: 1,4-alpha-glucan branching protein GlgB [Halomonas]MYL27833.1 1,4-alpha-glucan branching protein GlgB [Halomonas utahensis]MYL74959.1 1,4-alpha-glucan branching protein GlgB [Halomonas sp. 22501_18_FS]